jgi:hypothetical protein
MYLDAGLPAPQLRLDPPLGGGTDWPGYEYVADVVRSLLPMLQQMGVGIAQEVGVETLADRLRAEAAGQPGAQLLPILIGAWARKPSRAPSPEPRSHRYNRRTYGCATAQRKRLLSKLQVR